jgi:hypothetical protein
VRLYFFIKNTILYKDGDNMVTDEMRDNKNHIKYRVDDFDVIFANGHIEKVEGDLVSHVYIEKDYDDLFFPIVNISVMMKDELYHKIKQENDTVKFRIRIIKNIYDKDYKFLKYELYCNEVFICFKDKENIIEENKRVESKKTNEGVETVTLGSNMRDFYLFTDEVTKCKKYYNLSIESATLSDLLIYLIGDAGISQLLMTKLENNRSLNDYTIPSGNLVETINYLNNQLSFYRKGMTLFFDIDTAYLIDKNYKCTSWRKNEVRITHIHVANQEGNDSQLNGYFINKDRKQTHVFANTDRVKLRNSNIVSNQIDGYKIKVINSKSGSTSQINPNITTVGNTNEQILTIKENSAYAVSDLQTRIEENECICGVTLIGVDTEVVSPNKEILITYEDQELNKKYGGNYRVAKTVTTLSKDGEELLGEVQVILKQQK